MAVLQFVQGNPIGHVAGAKEGMSTLPGTGVRPKDRSWQDHAHGAVAHGFVTKLLLRVLGGYRPRG